MTGVGYTPAASSAGGTPDDNSVTSAKIVDGAIVNADVNASAAIALSKLASVPLVAASNLSDLVTPATARTNIGIPDVPFGSKVGGAYYSGMPGWMAAGGSGALGALSQYDIYTWPIFVPRPITVTGWDAYVNSGQEAAKVLRVGFYSASGEDAYGGATGVPALEGDASTATLVATGAIAKTGLSIALTAGWHLCAVGADASAVVMYGYTASCHAQPFSLAAGSGVFQNTARWWFDYTSSPNYPNAGFPATLTGSTDHATAFETAAAPVKLPVTLRWTNP